MASWFRTIQPAHCRKQGRVYTLTTTFLVGLLAPIIGQIAPGNEKPRPAAGKTRAAAAGVVARNAAAIQRQLDQRLLFGHLLYRNRQQQVMLSRAVDKLAEGKTTDGLIYLQNLLDAPEDGFAWLGSKSRLVSVRREAARILGAQSSQVLRAYERINGATAQQLLDEARQTGEPDKFREVGRRFYFTSAGFTAIDWQASRWLDQGRPGQAARAWKQLIAEPAHKRRVTLSMLAKAAVAHRLAGQHEAAAKLVQRLDGSRLRLGDGTQADVGLLTRRLPKTAQAVGFARRAVLPGEHGHLQADRVSTPFLEPLWNRRYSTDPSVKLDELVGKWENRQRENLQPVAVANSAIVADSAVVVRDFEYIRAFDAPTGKLRWSYRCATSLASISRDALKRGSGRSSSVLENSVDVKKAYASNATLGMLSTDGHRVYAVDFLDLRKKARSSGRFSNLSKRSSKNAANVVSREANRLIALNVDPNPDNDDQQQPIWSIGGAVETPDWFVRMDRNRDGRIVQAEFTGKTEQFKKIDSNTDSAISLREAAESAGWSGRLNPLGGHFFLGPPLAVDGCLYAVTEADRQLNLVAINPENGELLWMQAIGFVEVPIDRDGNRYPLHCTPSFADGILICPTQLGLLVGVDSLSGSLLWVYYYGDSEALARLGRWPHRAQRSYGHAGFPSIAHIDNGRVVVLPRQSDSIHCLDLQTGIQSWKIPRDDAEYIGTVRDNGVMIVGLRTCRGLSLDSGEEIWRTRLGMPSGRGLPAGNKYLVPLQQGRIATLDLSTGREIGFTLPRNQQVDSNLTAAKETAELSPASANWHPSNLIAVGDLVLSAGSRRLVAFPQSAPLLAKIQRDLNGESAATEDTIRLAELGLALGQIDRARDQLTTILAETMPDSHRDRAEVLLRELLYLELKQHTGNDRLFAQLEQLSRSPTLRGRFLMQRAEAQLQQRDFAGVLRATRELSALNLNRPLPTVNDSSLQVTAAGWLPDIIGRVQEQFGSGELVRALAHIDSEQQQALTSSGVGRLVQFLTVYSLWPQADAPRAELARRYIAAGLFHEAELLLLVNRNSDNQQTAAVATTILAQLWDRLGLWQEAAGLVDELDEKFADVRLGNDRTGRDFSALFNPSSLMAHALRQRQLPGWRISRVEISERPWTEANPELIKTYGSYRRRFATGGGTTYQLLVKGNSSDEKLAVIDRPTGKIVAHVAIPSRVSYPSSGKTATIGHFIPLGSPAAMNGVSLLARGTGTPVWTTRPAGMASRKEVLRVGPAGPSFCSFQAKRHLIVVAPSSGRILWQRTDLEPGGGLLNDPYAGLFGDGKVLVLFSSNRTAYTVYQTATGKILREGRLDVEINQQRRVFGRKLCYIVRLPTGRRIRIWDPLTDQIEFDEAIGKRLYSTVTSERELAVILPPGRMVIVDVATGRRRLDYRLELDELASLNYVRVFSDGNRYYLNLQRTVRIPPSRTYSYYASDTFLDAVHVQGDLLAVNRQTGRLDWKRMLPQRSVIRLPQFRLPFLIAMSGVRNRWNGNKQSLLVEVIDTSTGETIVLKDNIYPDRIVQCTYNPQRGRILLHGLKTLVELRFDRPRQLLSADNEPL